MNTTFYDAEFEFDLRFFSVVFDIEELPGLYFTIVYSIKGKEAYHLMSLVFSKRNLGVELHSGG